jgi:hypothetical protein
MLLSLDPAHLVPRLLLLHLSLLLRADCADLDLVQLAAEGLIEGEGVCLLHLLAHRLLAQHVLACSSSSSSTRQHASFIMQ